MTKQQQLIMDIIRGSREHLTAEQIFMQAKQTMPRIAFGTIYRNLSAMVSDGQIRRITVGEGEADRYDRTVTEHGHILCTVCGEMRDVDTDGLRELIRSKTGIEFDTYELCLKYVCKNCRSSAQDDPQRTL